MPQIPVSIRPIGFDPERIRLLPRGRRVLVMDRRSGRWVAVDRDAAPLVQLAATPASALPERLRSPISDTRRMLMGAGVGVPASERHFSDLNTVILKLTNACNFGCTYCYDYETFERATALPVDAAVDAVTQALELVPSHLCVILHGGEPTLMWERVEDIVQAGEDAANASRKRIQFVGQTNLSKMDDRFVSFSTEHQIAWGISIDGVAEVNDALRTTHSGFGTYRFFTDALQRYPEFVRTCSVMSTITRLNQGRLLEAALHFRDLGMPSWDWSLFQPIGRGRAEAGRLGLDAARLVEAWTQVFEAVVSGEFDGFGVLPVKKYIDNFVNGPGANMCMRGECGAARDLLSISSDGAIEACDCIDPSGPLSPLGHLSRDTLAEARESPVAASIRGRDLSRAPCNDCIWFGVCGGTCLAHAPSLNEVWGEGCAVAMRAFDAISASLAQNDALIRYLKSLLN